nr:complex I subunit 5 family protein [Lachnospiraceae bacterium]
MAENRWLTILPLLPFAGALLLCAFRGKGRERALYLAADLLAAAEFILALLFAVPVLRGGGFVCRIEELCGFGLSFEMDGFRAVWLVILSFMWLTAVVFSEEYMKHHEHVLRYYCFTFLTLGATAGVFLSADLTTTFLFFELMSFTSYVWVAQEETKGALRAAETYLAVAVLGGMVMLMGLFLLYHLTGTLAIDELKEACGAVQDRGMLLAAGLLMLFGFGAKAGMFPLHIWLPKAHPVAPAPASALLSGVLTKAGIFGVILLSGSILYQEKTFGWIVLLLGTATMFHGAVLGVFSIDLKRTLACSSVSQIGFILVGLGMVNLTGGDALAVRGSFLHAVNHSLIKLVLFLLAGVVFCRLHSLDLTEIRGFGRKKPFFLAAFLAGALAVGGMPLFSGYISKTLLHEAILEGGELYGGNAELLLSVIEWVFLVSGGMTVAYMLKLFFVLFVDEPSERVKKHAGNYLSLPVRILLAVPASFLLLAGLLPNRILLPLAGRAAGFFGVGALESAETPHSFSGENL